MRGVVCDTGEGVWADGCSGKQDVKLVPNWRWWDTKHDQHVNMRCALVELFVPPTNLTFTFATVTRKRALTPKPITKCRSPEVCFTIV
jgi:hypothetical protein